MRDIVRIIYWRCDKKFLCHLYNCKINQHHYTKQVILCKIVFIYHSYDMSYLIITTTTDNQEKAKEIATTLITKKIAACVQIDTIQSTYTWEDQLKNTTEYRLSIKTKETLYDEVAVTIRTIHNYQTPEIIATMIRYISEDYA